MVLDWPRVGAIILLVLAGGGFGVFELMLKKKRSPRGGGLWLALIFAIDAVVAVLAYIALDAALADEFWGNPYLIYIVALVWSPFILRAQYEFLVPGGASARDFFRVLPASREFLAARVHIGSARYVSNWMNDKVVPAARSKGNAALADRAAVFFENLSSLPEDARTALIAHIRRLEGDSAAQQDTVTRSIAQVMMDNGAMSVLKEFVGR